MQNRKTAQTLELNEKDLKRIAGGMTIVRNPRPTNTTTVSGGSSGGSTAPSGGGGDPMNQLDTGGPK